MSYVVGDEVLNYYVFFLFEEFVFDNKDYK